MLDVGRVRAETLGFVNGRETMKDCTVDWVCANAEQLPFADNTFTAYTIAFGIRNCTHIDKVQFLMDSRRSSCLKSEKNKNFNHSGVVGGVQSSCSRRTLYVP